MLTSQNITEFEAIINRVLGRTDLYSFLFTHPTEKRDICYAAIAVQN